MTENPETEKSEIQVQIEDEGPCKKRMKAEIPAESVTGEINDNYAQLVKTIQVPGFRKGRVPRSVLERRYSEKIEEEVREELMYSSFEEEIEKQELRILGTPKFDNVEFQVGEPFRYDAIFEIHPTFDLPEYKNLEVEAQKSEVTDEDLDRELESVRQQWASFESVSFGEQGEDDLAVVDLILQDGDEELLTRNEVYLKIGQDRVDNIVVDGLGEKLCAAAENEELNFEVTIPEDFPREELRNREVALKLQVQRLSRRALPELDDEFAEKCGAESVEDLRSNIRSSLETRRKIQEDQRQEEELVKGLARGLEMELPASVIDARKHELSVYESMRLQREGKSNEEIEDLLKENDASWETTARDDIKQLFLLDRIAEEERIFVTEDELAMRVQAIAATQNRDPNEILEEYHSHGRLDELRNSLLREKVRAFIREQATAQGADSNSESAAEPAASEENTVKE